MTEPESEEEREFGKVKWFSPRRGYGFIIRDNIPPEQENHEIFCHFSSIEMDGFKTLLPDLRVSFEIAPGKREVSEVAIWFGTESSRHCRYAQEQCH